MNTPSTNYLADTLTGPRSHYSPLQGSDTPFDHYRGLIDLMVTPDLNELEADENLHITDLEELICVFHQEILDIKKAIRRGKPIKAQQEYVDLLQRGLIMYRFCLLNGVFLKAA